MKYAEMLLAAALAAAASPLAAETPAERGAYLANSIVACGNCHTPITEQGEPIMDSELAGRFVIEMDVFTAYAPNITPDMETGIGSWSDDEIITAIREGRRPDGTIIGPPMPIELYRGMSDNDAAAIVAYLRGVPAVSNEMPKSDYRIPLPESYGPPVGEVADVPRGVSVEYGAYLAGPAGHCVECHTPQIAGRRDFENQLGAGGFEFEGPWGVSVSANITSDPEDGIAGYTDEQLKQIITTGVRPDDTRMLPPMAYHYYANLSDDDLDAIILYLRSLPPKPFAG